MLRFDRGLLLAATRAGTGVEARADGVRDRDGEAELGERLWVRGTVPFTVWWLLLVLLLVSRCGDCGLLEWTGVPGLRGMADILLSSLVGYIGEKEEEDVDGFRKEGTMGNSRERGRVCGRKEKGGEVDPKMGLVVETTGLVRRLVAD